jgi:hypothetical protein
MIRTRTIIHLIILAICIGSIVAGITLCIIDQLKGGIALLIIGFVVSVLLYCDRRCAPPDTSGLAAVVVHEQPRSQQ